MKRTTISLDPDIEVLLKLEAMRRKEPMAEVIREALRSDMGKRPATVPSGPGRSTAATPIRPIERRSCWRSRSASGDRRSVRDLKARIRFADGSDYGALAPGARDDGK